MQNVSPSGATDEAKRDAQRGEATHGTASASVALETSAPRQQRKKTTAVDSTRGLQACDSSEHLLAVVGASFFGLRVGVWASPGWAIADAAARTLTSSPIAFCHSAPRP
ncbi:unnamed protein product [Lota lota]